MNHALSFLAFLTAFLSHMPHAAADPLPSVVLEPKVAAISFQAEATVEAVHAATISSQLPGRILAFHVDAGQPVKRGSLLVALDVREAAEALRAAQAQFHAAEQHYNRQQQLLAQKFISQAAVDRAKADLDAAAAQRNAAGAQQSHGNLRAPMDGMVARRHAEPGDLAMPGSPLLTIYQPGSLRVTASVPQSRLPALRAGQGAQIEFPELGQRVVATAVQILPTVDPATQLVQVRVSLPPLPGLIPGVFARVHFLTGQAEKLSLPAKAIVRRGEVRAVYVQSGERVLLRQVRLGETLANGEIEVLAGLATGDQVVTDPVQAAMRLQAGR